jgi:hypothetical protein
VLDGRRKRQILISEPTNFPSALAEQGRNQTTNNSMTTEKLLELTMSSVASWIFKKAK